MKAKVKKRKMKRFDIIYHKLNRLSSDYCEILHGEFSVAVGIFVVYNSVLTVFLVFVLC